MSIKRMLTALAVTVIAVTLTASAAAAHVTVNPNEAEKGGFAKLAFRVPNERSDAGTTKLEVFFPEDHPLFSVNVRKVTGWTVNVERGTLDEPVEVFGEPRTDPISKITWEGGTIAPGEFEEFEISGGPLPEDADSLVFKAIQTYSSGEVVRWIEERTPGGEEPEHPAPVLTLVDAEAEDAATTATTELAAATDENDDDDSGDAIAIAALVVGILALIVGGVALARGGKKSSTPTA